MAELEARVRELELQLQVMTVVISNRERVAETCSRSGCSGGRAYEVRSLLFCSPSCANTHFGLNSLDADYWPDTRFGLNSLDDDDEDTMAATCDTCSAPLRAGYSYRCWDCPLDHRSCNDCTCADWREVVPQDHDDDDDDDRVSYDGDE